MSDEREERIKKVEVLKGLGVNPFGDRFDGAQAIAPIVEAYDANEGKDFTVAGRVTAFRRQGKVVFADLRDQTGKIQLFLRKNDIGDDPFEVVKNTGIGDVIAVSGELKKTKTGEISIFAKKFTFLVKSLRPLPEKWHGLKDPEVRYRQRYLDLIANPSVRETFLKRTKIINAMRTFLNDRGYVEVETPVLVKHAGGAAAKPFETHHNALDMDINLRISLEVPLKKIVVGGIDRVYEIGRVFRNEGIDANHNPEFTLLELYHAYGDLETMMELVESMVAHMAKEVCGGTKVPWKEGTLNVEPPWPRKDFFELIQEHAGVDPQDEDALRAKMKGAGHDPKGLPKHEVMDYVFGDFVEEKLQDAIFVINQPIEMTPLCREHPKMPGRAARFESFLAGAELSNAYTELNDPLEQRKRLEAQGGAIDEDFIQAMEHGMPPAGGMGMGIDRLVRLLTNQPNLREVIFFPTLRESNPGAPPDAK